MNRLNDLVTFYGLLGDLERKHGGKRRLADCSGRIGWPVRGVYFFFEPGEIRSDSGDGPRVVRVGTHGLKLGSGTSLWNRLSNHRGQTRSGRGNHRGSIFRLLIGTALKARGTADPLNSWDVGANARQAAERLGVHPSAILEAEVPLESAVSTYIRSLPFLWLEIGDAAGPESDRGVIERNSIALLSNFTRTALDPATPEWLGRDCDREKVRLSGVWNNRHVDEVHEAGFLSILERYVRR